MFSVIYNNEKLETPQISNQMFNLETLNGLLKKQNTSKINIYEEL